MKIKFYFFLLLLGLYNPVHAQVFKYETQNPNLGFGKNLYSSSNQMLDFVVNGPLVDEEGTPVGGYVDNQVTVKEWVNPENYDGNFSVQNGIFGLDVFGKLHLVNYSNKDNLPEMKWAFQNGPILVLDGVNTRGTSESKFPRSGIGFRKDGTLIVIVVLYPITFKDFANRFLVARCTNAIYLDGGPYVGCIDENGLSGSLVKKAIKLQFFNN